MNNKSILSIATGLTLGLVLLLIWSAEIIISPYVLTTERISLVPWFENHFLYFIHHAIAFIPVFIISLINPYYKEGVRFYSFWGIPVIIGSVIFLGWDIYFSKIGIWGFNSKYLSELSLYNFPIEEIIWFPVIAFSSLYIYVLMEHLTWRIKGLRTLGILFAMILILFWIVYFDRLYSSFAMWSVFAVIWLWYVSGIWGKLGNFILAFLVIIIPMIIMDGLLTGMFTSEALVIYNPSENSGIRIISIPVEDFLFGFGFLAFIVWTKNVITKRISAF